MKKLPLLLLLSLTVPAWAVKPEKPLKVLLLTGGCCHDYAAQKDILKEGLEKRANLVVDHVYSADKSTAPALGIYGKPNWASGYDVIIHDECAADIKDLATVEAVLQPHLDGVPGVNLHCAMHSYRTSTPVWFQYLGIQSSNHGAQLPIAISFEKNSSPIVSGMSDWTTGNEELYNNVKVFESVKVLARGQQGPARVAEEAGGKSGPIVVWTSEYGPKKTRVFSTTLGHNNQTVADSRYLDLVSRGVLWAAGRLPDDAQAGAAAATLKSTISAK
jgi:type 1 glutamine amidotransferase